MSMVPPGGEERSNRERSILDIPIETRQLVRIEHESLRNWYLGGHTVSINELVLHFDDGSSEINTEESLDCMDCPGKGNKAHCDGVNEVAELLADEAIGRYGETWREMEQKAAILDIVTRTTIYGEWMGQIYQRVPYFQNIQRLLELGHPLDVEPAATELQQEGHVIIDGFTIRPGQQLLLKHRTPMILRWMM